MTFFIEFSIRYWHCSSLESHAVPLRERREALSELVDAEGKGVRGHLVAHEEPPGNPVGVVTKSQLILRDLDILGRMAQKKLLKVAISLNTLDEGFRRMLEPRAASVQNRLKVIMLYLPVVIILLLLRGWIC